MPRQFSASRSVARVGTLSLSLSDRAPLLELGDHRRERALLPPRVADVVALAGGGDQRRLRQHLRLEFLAEVRRQHDVGATLGAKFKAEVLPQATLIAATGQRHMLGDAGWEESAFAPMVAEIKKW